MRPKPIMWSPSMPDRVALIALSGVAVSVVVWVMLAWADSVVDDIGFWREVLAAEPGPSVTRLGAIVLVLVSTLLFTMFYTRHLRTEDRYRRLIEESPDMVLVLRRGKIVFINSAGAELLGAASAEAALGLAVAGLFEPLRAGSTLEELVLAIQSGTLPKATPVNLHRLDGRLVDVELSAVPLSYEGADAVQCVARDISERVRTEQVVHRMAYYDPLTELPNRTLFRDRLSVSLARAKRLSESLGIMFVDLDGFKATNDSLGHDIGDGLLKAVGGRLREVVRAEDTVARQGGDEFTIIARLEGPEEADALAERILHSLDGNFDVAGHGIQVTASMGVAIYPVDGEDEGELLRNADAAMYRAKGIGPNTYRLYASDMGDSKTERVELQAGLRTALALKELELHYQPQVDMRDGSIVGVEALLRWSHPVRGLMLPRDFIELAEQAGLMGAIGCWVLTEACCRASEWHARGLDFGRIAVNLSARELVEQDLIDNVRTALRTSGLPASMLELELTETSAMQDIEHVLVILQDLREVGVRVAIDDFGTGYSSMSYLKRFPVQTLKIAHELVRDVHIDLQSAAIASTIIQLCRGLGLDIVAEGVEHPLQIEFLRECGCYVVQGHVFSKALPVGTLEELLVTGVNVAA